MLELHQFRHSAFCLKVRMALQAKGLSFREVEVTPGIGQVSLFRLSGQRQVPVLVDGDDVVSDSSAICRYLEEMRPEPALIPADPKQRAQMQLIEDWADTTLAAAVRSALLQAAADDAQLREVLLPDDVPSPVRQLMSGLPGGWLSSFGELLGQEQRASMLSSLCSVADGLDPNGCLVGHAISLADLALAAQLSLLRFPASSGESLAGRGVPGISDHPRLQILFRWRDQLETRLINLDPAPAA
ncbi:MULTISPECIES: glutathione S-transferase family protein [unclassified Synechococcus]|uniref:glutathione S-transferase family protein n=1 Tax=unclassified Synechococcus TaxID=2626047 RepID=UPI0039AF0AB1